MRGIDVLIPFPYERDHLELLIPHAHVGPVNPSVSRKLIYILLSSSRLPPDDVGY